MSVMYLVNPRPKKGKKKAKAKKRRTSRKVKTSTHHKGKVMAKKRKAKATKTRKVRKARKSKSRTVKMHTKKVRRARRKTHAVTARGKKRARKNATHHINGYFPNPKRRRRHGRKSNPLSIKGAVSSAKGMIMPVVGGVVASVALDKVMPMIPVPAMISQPGREKIAVAYQVGVRTLITVAAGMLARKVVSRDTADRATVGALTVTYTDLARSLLGGDHIAATAAVHGYDRMAGYDMAGYDTPRLAGDASYMGNFDNRVNSVNSTVA